MENNSYRSGGTVTEVIVFFVPKNTHTSIAAISWSHTTITIYLFDTFAEAIHDYCRGNLTVTGEKATAGIFATYPAPYLSLIAGFFDQVALKVN